MEKYNLTQTGQEVQDILDNATLQSDLAAEVERAQEAERLLGEGIQQNATDIDSIEGKIPSAATSENKLTDKEYVDGQVDDEKNRAQGVEGTLQDNIDAEETRAKAAERQNADDIDALEAVVPSGATSDNKLATESYVNDAVATSSATFRGTFNLVSDLHLTLEATHANIATALVAAIATADNNDFAFVQIPVDAETPTVIGSIERYKFNGTDWTYEYTLNNSGFTQAQWDSINSGITSNDVNKLAALPTNAQLTTLLNGKQDTLTFDNVPTENSLNPVKSGGVYSAIKDEETRAKAAEKANADDIDAIEEKIPSSASSSNQLATASDVDSLSAAIEAILLLIPSAASSLNQLADKAFVNSSIATATATFRGTYNLVNDLGLTISATHAQIATALGGAILTSNNNDYAFVQIPTSNAMPTEIAKTERYKFNGTAWEYEYDLNNSGFTADQWAAINSGITQALVTKLAALPTNAELTAELGTLTSGILTINQKIPNAASQANKLVDNEAMESYIVEVLNVLTVSYNVTSTDGHVTLSIEQVDGKVTSVTLTTSDIASAADLNLKASQADLTALASRVTTAESNITSLGDRVSTNETDIANLQQLYNNLQQSKPEPVTALPSTGQQQGVIYRLAETNSYSDYMWNGSTWVLMATYNNAIDPRPKKASQNLVTSGGVFDNIGALDVSELNATENPHTPAIYANLSAALADIPTDYQKGGMSITFIKGTVQSSDNNYIQFRCIADEFTTDTNYWVISEEGHYINNSSYIRVWTDSNDKLIFGVKSDGDIIFGVGVPVQIKEYILGLVESLSLESVNSIASFLDGLLNNGVKLSDLLNGKADIEKTENNTFVEVTIDKDSKLLEGRKKDGTKVICGDIELDKMSIIQIENNSYISVLTDCNDRIVFGLKKDGSVFIPNLESRSIDGIVPIKVNTDTNNTNVSDLTNTQGLSWNAVGTSVTQGYTRDGQAGSESIKPYLYVAQVANELGLQANNYGVGATTICKNMKSGAVVDFHVLNSSIVERVCGLNGRTAYPDADIWTIEGAPNDIFYNSKIGSIDSTKNDIDTVYGALKRIIEEIQGRSNNPRIMLIYWAFTKYEKDNEHLAYEIEKAFIWASNYYGVPMLNLRRESGLSPYNIYRLSIGDGIHPSADGTNMYKHKIAKFISNNI